MTSLVKYGSFNLGALEKQNTKIENTTSSSGADFMKLGEGRHRVRFVPPRAGDATPFKVVVEHFLKAKNGQRAVFACPRNSDTPTKCPACEEFFKLHGSSNPLDKDEARNYKVRTRIYANVRDRGKPETVRILAFPRTVWDGILRIAKDSEEGGDFVDPTESGFDMIITRKGTTMTDTKYTVTPSRTGSALAESSEELEEFIETQYDLDRYAHVPSLDDVLTMMQTGYKDQSDTTEVKALPPPKQSDQGGVYDLDEDDVPY